MSGSHLSGAPGQAAAAARAALAGTTPGLPAVAPEIPPVATIERRLASILGVGVAIAVALMGFGFVLLLASGRSPLETPWPPFDLSRLAADLRALRPEGFIWLGLLVAIATPLLRVIASVTGFIATGERRMAGLGVVVLIVLLVAVLTALAAGG